MVNRDVFLSGYFQSYKYFYNEYHLICRVIGLDKMKENLLKKLQLDNNNLNKTISMHFRIGDYKKVQEYHPLATYEFYERSLNYIKVSKPEEKFNILYFCEEVDIQDVLNIVNKFHLFNYNQLY